MCICDAQHSSVTVSVREVPRKMKNSEYNVVLLLLFFYAEEEEEEEAVN